MLSKKKDEKFFISQCLCGFAGDNVPKITGFLDNIMLSFFVRVEWQYSEYIADGMQRRF